MSTDEARALKPGLYRLYAYDGRQFDAYVGRGPTGHPWFKGEYESAGHNGWNHVREAVPLSVVPVDAPRVQTTAQRLAHAVLLGDTAAIPALLDECNEAFHDRPSVEERVREAAKAEQTRCLKIAEAAADHWRQGYPTYGTNRQQAAYDNRREAATIIASFIRRDRDYLPLPPFIEERTHAPTT